MEIKIKELDEISNIDGLVDESINGTAFCYEYFLKLKNVKEILCVYHGEKLIALMPLFVNGNDLNQSTMYIPYGGPLFLYKNFSYRKFILYTRNIIFEITNYLKDNYNSICFSLDPVITDIIPCVKNDFVPEVRYTYKIDLRKSIEEIYSNFGGDRKDNIKKTQDVEIILDDKLEYFNFDEALKWEYNYGNEISSSFVKEYVKESIALCKGKCFVARKNKKVLGGVAVVWDKKNCYIMYSFYDGKEKTVIPLLYYEIIKYLKDNNICDYLDFEGSVFKEIEEWNLSFGATQVLYFNLYYEKGKKKDLYGELYDYGEKNEKQF